MAYQADFAAAGYGGPAAPLACDNRNIPTTGLVQALTARRVACNQRNAFGEADPFTVVARAVARAVEMLDNTIGELVRARNAVCAGAPPAWPTLGDLTAHWLKYRLGVCIDDIRAWTAGTFVNRSVAEVIRRLTRVRNLIASNGLRYSCGSPSCRRDLWAFVIVDDAAGNCLPGTPQMLIRLCRAFWCPAVRADGTQVDPAVHAEFQAQTIIHEASHLTHCTGPRLEHRGSHTIGAAECLTQFVAATNGSPIDCDFVNRCLLTNRCGGDPAGGPADPCVQTAAAPRAPAGGGLAAPPAPRILATIFRSQDAIRLPGRLAVRPAPADGRRLGYGGPRFGEAPGDVIIPAPDIDPGILPCPTAAQTAQFIAIRAAIIAQLNRNIRTDDEKTILERRQILRNLFNSVPTCLAGGLLDRLVNMSDPLAKLFHGRLHRATRREMMDLLARKSGRFV
jgi:hypothetical protein